MALGIINIGYTLCFPQIIWLHSCDSGVTLRKSVYERINFCAIKIKFTKINSEKITFLKALKY